MSLTAAPTNWIPFNQAIKTINFPNPLQGSRAAMADWTRGSLHTSVGWAMMAAASTAKLVGADSDTFIKGLVDFAKPFSTNAEVRELAHPHMDKIGDGLHHIAVTSLDQPMLLTGFAAALIGAGFGLRGQLRQIAQSNKLSKQGAVPILQELLPQKVKAAISKVV